jgi:hypothetical protein
MIENGTELGIPYVQTFTIKVTESRAFGNGGGSGVLVEVILITLSVIGWVVLFRVYFKKPRRK